MASLTEDLLEQGMELRETHISRVFLAADTVYKLKKPVNLGFVDFTTLERRKHFCEAEVSLNQRLATGVYLGVVPIVRDASGVHRIAAAGEPVDWAVVMRRLDAKQAADALLEAGQLNRDHIQRLAQHLAEFHAQARCDQETAHFGELALIEANVRENFAQTRDNALAFVSAQEFAALETWQLDFLRQRRAQFEQRIGGDRIRDGHGDLRLEHCYFEADGSVQIIDCIEFNERFRYADVCADIAFLSMDLTWHGRPDLSEDLLLAYARASDDYDLYALVDFYESYRAHVRAKVSSFVYDDASTTGETRARAAAEARKYYLLAVACAREPVDEPWLIAVGGLIASGKSTIADALAASLHAPVIDSDRTRKHLLGVDPYTALPHAAFHGAYGPDVTQRTYDEVLRRASAVLRSRRSVIIDASFREHSARQAALELARSLGVRFQFLECATDADTARRRLAARAQGPSVSDGRQDLYDAFVSSYEPVHELPTGSHLRLDTAQPLRETLAQIARETGLANVSRP